MGDFGVVERKKVVARKVSYKPSSSLFIPGPTNVHVDVLAEMANPQIGHRTKDFSELFASVKPGLKNLFHTENDVLISTSSGSGLWEAAVRSCVNKKVLHAVNGAFSKKWANVSERCGKEVTKINYDFGKAIKAADIDHALNTGKYEAFCMVHNETSTGVASDLEEISKVMKKHDVLWFVDAVSSFSGMKIEVDKLGIDICLASTQKALALPAGLSVASVSRRAFDKAKTVEGRGYYFDILELKKMYDKDQTPYTASIPHLYALKKQLERIEAEGLTNRFERHEQMAKFVRSWALQHGFELFSEDGFHSNTLTCIRNTKNIDFGEIKKDMARKGFTIDSGYGKLNEKLAEQNKPTTFRISHMGEITIEDIQEFTKLLEEYWK